MKKRIILSIVLLLSSGSILYVVWNQTTIADHISTEISALYTDHMKIKDEVTSEKVNEIQAQSKALFSKKQQAKIQQELQPLLSYTQLKERLDACFDSGVLKSSVSKQELEQLQEQYQRLSSELQSQLKDKLSIALSQKKAIDQALSDVDALLQEGGIIEIADTTTWDSYKSAKDELSQLPQVDLQAAYEKKLTYVKDTLTQQDEAQAAQEQREKEEKQRKINPIHMIEGVPYVNQLDEKVYSGCEAASLLMGLQYRGLLPQMTLPEFAQIMPKSDDPHQGFRSNIFTYEPRSITHWIAPDALAAFGQTYYDGVVDISGATPEALRAEIDNGNPVVVYGTDRYLEATGWDGEVPLNLHVQILVGYNAETGAYILHDPGYNEISFPKEQFEKIYNYNQFAVAIR